MDRQLRNAAGLVVGLLLLVGTFAPAQDTVGDFSGTVTLRSGEVLTGTIRLAEFGVVFGSGIGTLREEYGSLRLKVNEEEVSIPARDIWAIDAAWEQEGEGADARWLLASITVTKKDGTRVVGEPTWLLHCSTASVILDTGESRRVHAFPMAQTDFSPDNFIKSVSMGTETPPAEPVTPAEPAEPVTPAEPAEPVTPAEPAEPVTPAEPAEPVTPAEPAEPVTPAEPAFAAVPVRATLTFTNVDAAQVAELRDTVAAHAVDGKVDVSVMDGEVTMVLVLADASHASAVADDVKYRLQADGSRTLVFEETDRQLTSNFRTATIRGAVKVTVSFMITPGAKLFYSPAAGEEAEVPADKIAEDGKVTLDVQIARGQEFVYGRTVLGEVEKCIKIDIFTGDVTEITKADYEAHK